MKNKTLFRRILNIASATVLLAALAACQAPAPVPPPATVGIISGKVTNSLTKGPVAGVIGVLEPAVPGVSVNTTAAGTYSAQVPGGVYKLTFQKVNYTPDSQSVAVPAGQTVTRDIALKPVKPVVVSAGINQSGKPGAALTLTATAEALDGSTITGYQWQQTAGVSAALGNSNTKTLNVTLNNAGAYKASLLKELRQLDRFMIQPINPLEIEEAETASFQVTVTTGSGKYTASVNVLADLSYVVTSDIRNVATGVPLLFHGKTQKSYTWTVTAPPGSKAVLQDATTQDPSLTPDIAGQYILTETVSKNTITFYAGTWQGAITSQDQGHPQSLNCITCHNGKVAADKFTAWKQTGHSEIFTVNLNTSTHYDESCFSCHTVGFNKSAANNGFDDAPDYNAFLKAGLLNKPDPNNWTKVLSGFPKAAQLANIQCENCHGPNNQDTLHPNKTPADARNSLSADLCGTCHGEPLRHGRFQQWQESTHSDFTLALAEGTVENTGANAAHCGRCHSAQGFLSWISQGDLTKRIQGAKGDATADELKAKGLTVNTVQPLTCTVCHDPHGVGKTSGEPNTAAVRITDNTPTLPAGFAATNVGRGAICITCHNTRNGLHNDSYPPANYSAPHSSSQGDVLLGQNAYLVTAQRSPHSFITDTCTACHMEATPPPPLLSYNQTGTNHSFKAGTDICKTCHSAAFNGPAFQADNKSKIDALAARLGTVLLQRFSDKVTIMDYTPHTYSGTNYDIKSQPLVVDKANILSATPVEPHGQLGFIITFKSPLNFTYAPQSGNPHTMSLKEAQVQMGDITTDGKTPVIPASDPLVKAAWDYFLLHSDGSEGVHNPGFTSQALTGAMAALK